MNNSVSHIRSAAPARRGATATSVLLLLGAISYTAWVLEAFLSTGLDPVKGYVSELAADDQPLGVLFRTTDLIAGLLLLAGAVIALVTFPRRGRRWATAGWAGIALFGASTMLDSRLPLSCAPTSDASCARREAIGHVPFSHSAHSFTSSIAMVGAVTAVVVLTIAARKYGWWPPLRRVGPALVVAELLATVWTLASIEAFTSGNGTWALGIGQRLQVLFIAVYVALLAFCVARAGKTGEMTAAHDAPSAAERAAQASGADGRGATGSSGGSTGDRQAGSAGRQR